MVQFTRLALVVVIGLTSTIHTSRDNHDGNSNDEMSHMQRGLHAVYNLGMQSLVTFDENMQAVVPCTASKWLGY